MQLATLLIGLISATALWSGVQALNQQARNPTTARPRCSAARAPRCWCERRQAFAQQLFVDLRRAGWPVSPVVEGRIPDRRTKLRLLGIEPMTLPAKSVTRRRGARRIAAFITPPGQMLVAAETLVDLKLTEGARPRPTTACGCRRCVCNRASFLTCWWSIRHRPAGARHAGQLTRLLVGKTKGKRAALASVAGDRLRLVEPDAETTWSSSPTVSISTSPPSDCCRSLSGSSSSTPLSVLRSSSGCRCCARCDPAASRRACSMPAGHRAVAFALVAGLAGLVCGYFIAAALLPDVAASLRGSMARRFRESSR
jgi:putative ABC transport system permease protein